MKSLSGRMAIGLNELMRRRGAVFADRYHAHPLSTPPRCGTSSATFSATSRRTWCVMERRRSRRSWTRTPRLSRSARTDSRHPSGGRGRGCCAWLDRASAESVGEVFGEIGRGRSG
jgi:hypothetical protein